MTDRIRAIEGLALVATLTSVFGEIHPLCDQFVQDSHDAMTKGMHGSHLVYVNDGSPVEENPWRTGKEGRTCTASSYGRRSVCRHVASVWLVADRDIGQPVLSLIRNAEVRQIAARQLS
ncbi:hypothetical protein [Streptomyces sp. NPDC101115]|uniref:hypothetical protein n=1 Tax=Streptomyces sp. NPDC101115 TaxID=3366106 RepID=UPI003822D976